MVLSPKLLNERVEPYDLTNFHSATRSLLKILQYLGLWEESPAPPGRDPPVKEITLPNSYDLIPNILQEPLRWQLPAHAFFLCQLVHPASAGCKLKPLSPGIDEKSDLARVGPSRNFARFEIHKVFKKAAAVIVHFRIRDARPFLGLAGNIADVPVESDHPLIHGLDRISPQLHREIAALDYLRTNLTGAHTGDVGSLFEPFGLIEYDSRRIRAGRHDVRPAHGGFRGFYCLDRQP